MKRRELMLLLGGATTAAWPVRAQQKAMPVIGLLSIGLPGAAARWLSAFRQGLGETGFIEGQNVAIEYRFAEGQYDRLPAMAADLVGRKVDVIAAGNVSSALVAKSATSTIPIVFVTEGDSVADGLVASLARPGGNLTGFSMFGTELMPKRLELLSELVPQPGVIALLVNPNNVITERIIQDAQEAARTKGLQLHILKASTDSEIDAAFAALAQRQAGALLIGADGFFYNRREQFAALAAQLWAQPHRYVAQGWHLCRKDPKGRQARRSAGSAADGIRIGRQPEDRQGARPDDPPINPRPCRRGHRVRQADDRFWSKLPSPGRAREGLKSRVAAVVDNTK